MTGPGTDDEPDAPSDADGRSGRGDADGRGDPGDANGRGDPGDANGQAGPDAPAPADSDETISAGPDDQTPTDSAEGDTPGPSATERDGTERAPNGSGGPPLPNSQQETQEFDGPLDWFLNTESALVVTIRDVGNSVLTVALIGLVLFAVSGIWPPLVAVESGSMEPHMHRNDLVFVVEEDRYAPGVAIDGTGVVTHDTAESTTGYWSFGNYGNVIIYQPDGSDSQTPIIHRAMLHVEKGENWYDRANPDYFHEGTDSCQEVRNNACPAPYDGFITKGDHNAYYDQVGSQSSTVKSEWIRGKAKIRIPLLGWIRLQFTKLATGFGAAGPAGIETLRLELGVVSAGVATVVSRRRGWL